MVDKRFIDAQKRKFLSDRVRPTISEEFRSSAGPLHATAPEIEASDLRPGEPVINSEGNEVDTRESRKELSYCYKEPRMKNLHVRVNLDQHVERSASLGQGSEELPVSLSFWKVAKFEDFGRNRGLFPYRLQCAW